MIALRDLIRTISLWVLILSTFVRPNLVYGNECGSRLERTPTISENDKELALQNLQANASTEAWEGGYALIDVTDGKAKIKIKFLSNANISSIALYNAVRAGVISEIDAGTILSPKVLSLVDRLRTTAPPGQKIVVRGELSPGEIESRNGKDVDDVYDWLKYSKALRDLGVLDACKKFFGVESVRGCGNMRFVIDSTAIGDATWEPSI